MRYIDSIDSLCRLGAFFSFCLSLASIYHCFHLQYFNDRDNDFLSASGPDRRWKREGGGLSACLLVKDENHNLPEWLAYHYFNLPLQYLVVSVDPNSVTSPSKILSRWREEMGMDIVEWDDSVFLPKQFRGPVPWNSPAKTHIVRHHLRQNWFLAKCMKYHKLKNRTWTILIDVDEYITFNTISFDDANPYFEKDDSSSSSYTINKSYVLSNNIPYKDIQLLETRTKLPHSIFDKTIAQFIHEQKDSSPFKIRSCIVFPRLSFGNFEPKNVVMEQEITPEFLNPKRYNTLRFFRHARKGNITANLRGKPIVDVARIPLLRFNQKANYPHCPLRQCGESEYAPNDFAIFKVNHYSLSKEAYFAQSNKRRTLEMYKHRGADSNYDVSYEMKPWLGYFVQHVGHEKAKIFLAGAGEIGNLKRPDDHSESSNRS